MRMRLSLPASFHRRERGQVIIFAMLALVFLLVVAGGLASDVASLIALKGEIQSSLDAASLAGAGKLGFDAGPFPTVRDFAVNFAAANPTRRGTVTLDRNDANTWDTFATQSMPFGDVILGVWDPSKADGIGPGLRFEPSLNGSTVNAVMCRYKRQIPASFLSLWGLIGMSVQTSAVAVANPPANPPACVFPMGMSSCPFTSPSGIFSSQGCGVNIKFVTSSGQSDSTNTAAWVNMSGTGTPNSQSLVDQINNASNGAGCGANPGIGNNVGTNNGMDTPAFNAATAALKAHFDPAVTHTIKDSNGNVTYSGPGWEIAVPVIQTSCPPSGITGDHQVLGWTKMVMTQAWDNTGNNKPGIGEGCVVNNSADSFTWQYCQMAKKDLPSSLSGGNSRSLWGYYSCTISASPPVENPVPRAALATKLRLVR